MISKDELVAMGIALTDEDTNLPQANTKEITSKICIKCKLNIDNDSKFCVNCGAEQPIYQVYGNMGTTLIVYENRCIISTTSTGKAFMFGGLMKATRGDKEIYYSDITSVQFKNLETTTGFIQFEYPGSQSGNNYTSENSFIFSATIGTNRYHELQRIMPPIYEYIQKRIRVYKENKNSTATIIKQDLSSADEIKKFKDLLDAGIISQEEFDAKKKQLLGL